MATETLQNVDIAGAQAQPSRNAMATPHLILLGYGVGDSLQLTVEAQRLLARYGSAYSIGLPANLAAFLKSQRVKVTDLAGRFAPGREYAEAYLDIANFLIERTAKERPVLFLAPGHPMLFNAVSRYLAMEGKRLELGVQVVPGVSPIDVIAGAIGLDVSTFGLQVFDATRLVARRIPLSPQVPAILMNLDAFAANAVPGPESRSTNLEPLLRYLAGCYPPHHAATVVSIASGVSVASAPLGQLASLSAKLPANSHLFLDLVRPSNPTQGTTAN